MDLTLGIDVVPIPGLQQAFATVGFTTGDLTSIYVDEFVYLRRPRRYRLTLAHEIGHVFLHADFYRAYGWTNLTEWKQMIQDIPEDQYRFMEWHANAFAGLILVPGLRLEKELAECRRRVEEIAPAAKDEPEAYREFVEVCMSETFDVSSEVISKRLEKRGKEE